MDMEVILRISRLQVRGFGKIEDFNTTLSSGLNVVYGPNESGKSTLMEFIKAMLYGLKGGRTSKDGVIAATKRYMPWSNGSYGGYMNFTLDDGRTFRIDRAFDNMAVRLYDESFNDITNSFIDTKDGSGIAERLIGLNESLFERTVYIKQLGTRIDNSDSKDLIDRISNMRQSGSEEISFKKANAALKEALKQQVGTDRSYTRPLDIINKRLGELNNSITIMQDENKKLLEAKVKQEALAFEISKLIEKEKLFSKLKDFCDLKENLKFQKEKQEDIRFLNDGIKQAQNSINAMYRDKTLLEQELDNNTGQSTILDEQEFAVMDDKIQKQRTLCKVWNLCSIVSILAVIGIGCGAFIFELIELWLTAIPVLIAIIFVTLSIKGSSVLEVLEDEQGELYEKSDKLKNELENVKRIEQVLQQQLSSLNDRITKEKDQYEQLLIRQETQNINFKQIDIASLEKEIDRVSEIISELRITVDQDLTRTEKELLENILENNNGSHYISLNEIKEFLTAQIQQKKVETATLEANIKKNEDTSRVELIEDEIVKLTQQKRRLEQRGEALSIAIRILEESTNNVQKKYIPVMNKVFKETFSGLTGEKYSDIRAGENLSIMLSDPRAEIVVPVTLLSNGTIDQMYLALRIAISETVLKINESLPFIMDEPFAQYDDERTDNALKYIYDISKKQQVIIFTCKQREVDLISSKYPCKICSLT